MVDNICKNGNQWLDTYIFGKDYEDSKLVWERSKSVKRPNAGS